MAQLVKVLARQPFQRGSEYENPIKSLWWPVCFPNITNYSRMWDKDRKITSHPSLPWSTELTTAAREIQSQYVYGKNECPSLTITWACWCACTRTQKHIVHTHHTHMHPEILTEKFFIRIMSLDTWLNLFYFYCFPHFFHVVALRSGNIVYTTPAWAGLYDQKTASHRTRVMGRNKWQESCSLKSIKMGLVQRYRRQTEQGMAGNGRDWFFLEVSGTQGIWIDISIYYLTPTNFSNKRTLEEETFNI